MKSLGHLKLQGIVNCVKDPRQPVEIQLFIFEQLIIVANVLPKKSQHDGQEFLYITQIKVFYECECRLVVVSKY